MRPAACRWLVARAIKAAVDSPPWAACRVLASARSMLASARSMLHAAMASSFCTPRWVRRRRASGQAQGGLGQTRARRGPISRSVQEQVGLGHACLPFGAMMVDGSWLMDHG